MLNKLPEEYLYEYAVLFEGQEIASYYSDAVPPEIGSLLNPWEFVSDEVRDQKHLAYMGPYRIIEVDQQPKNMDGNDVEVAKQTLVHITVDR